MAKLESLSDVTGVNSEAHNANNDRLTQAFENTLSRDGSMPNTMNASLDMNGRFILNLPTPSNNSHAATKAYVDGTAIAHPSITQSNVGAALWPQTQAENDASVTPSNYAYPPGDVRRYGAVGDGVTDDTTAITAAFLSGHGVIFSADTVYAANDLAIEGTGVVPPWIEGNGSTLKAKNASAVPVLLVENPHSQRAGFYVNNLIVDGDNKAPTFKIHGCQFASFRNVRTVKSTTYGFHLKGESSYGIYYNSFENCQAGANGQQNADTGWHLDGTGANYYIASNTFSACRSQFNKEHGWHMDYANNLFCGCEAEKNDKYGWSVDHAYSVDIHGGYSENNHLNWATDGVGDGGTDENFTLTANSTGVRIMGGRHIGTPAGTWTGLGNWYAPGYSGVTEMPNLDTAGKMTLTNLAVRAGGGLGFSGATPPNGGVNGAEGWEMQAAGSQVLLLHGTCSADQAGLSIRHNAGGGGVAVERVTVGASDSGGSGYRVLRIPN